MSNLSRRTFLKAAATGLAALGSPSISVADAGQRSNIVLILMDDMGCKDAGYLGSDFYETPNMNRLAREGVVFTNAYANAPNCAPTRACIMSGQYTPRHGIYTVDTSIRGEASKRMLIPIENRTTLGPEYVTLAEALRDSGYTTFHGGKWHLGEGPETGPEGQGFVVNIGGCRAGAPPGGYFAPWNAPNLNEAPKGTHLCDYITDKALAFIRTPRRQPFFLYLPYYDVHSPIEAKDESVAKYRSKLEHFKEQGITPKHTNPVYAAMLETADQNIGRILDALDETGNAGNTLVLFFSDNGGYGGATNMRPLRGCKGMLYEGGIREPLIIRWPGKAAPGICCDTPVIGVDFYPTLLEAAQVTPPTGTILDGISLLPLLNPGGRLPERALYWHFPCYLQGIPAGFEADSHDGIWRTTPAGAIRDGDWKLIEFFDDGSLELYNLRDDEGERRNLVRELPDKTRAMHERLKSWRRAVNAPVPNELNPEYRPPRPDSTLPQGASS